MSQQQVVQDYEEYSKEIVMNAYAPLEFEGTLREWARDVSDIDCVSTETNRETRYKLNIEMDDWRTESFNLGERFFTDDRYRGNEIRRQLKKVDHINIDKETVETTDFLHSLSFVKREFMRELWEKLPDEISGGYEQDYYSSGNIKTSYYDLAEDEDESDTRVIKCKAQGFDERRILKKETDREPGAMFESVGEVPSFQFTLTLEAPLEELLTDWTDEVIVELHKLLSNIDAVGKVRYTSCETSVTKSGECFVDL